MSTTNRRLSDDRCSMARLIGDSAHSLGASRQRVNHQFDPNDKSFKRSLCPATWPSCGAPTRRSLLTARKQVVLLEESCLVGEHDRLYAVAEVELLKDVRDVRLDGGFADVELVSDLRVRQAASHQAKDVSFAITELVELLGRSRT